MISPLVSRLVAVVDGLAADVDVPALLQQISLSAQALLRASAAGLVVREGPELRVVAIAGPHPQLIGRTFPLQGSAVGELLASGRRSLLAEGGTFSYLDDELFDGDPLRLAVALTRADGAAALYVLRDEALTVDEVEVLELLAASAGAALRSSQMYAEALAARHERDAVIDAMADGLAVLDAAGLVRSWNRALAEVTGLPAHELVGRAVPFPLPAVGETLDHQLPNGRWIEVIVAEITGTSDRVVDVRDVTRPKEVEAGKDLFLAIASHELRTPLTVLRGFGETLLHHWDVLDDERRREIVRTILVRTQAMNGLVDQLLLGSRAGMGVDVRVHAVDLAAVVRSAAAAIAGSQPDHPLLVKAASPVPALGDEATVEAVLGQLVENAVKYSPAGGPIEIRVCIEDDAALLQVSDTGVGIDEEDLERVFDRFVRSDAGRGSSATGAGLGLWIVRRYLDAMGGRVLARRRCGGGTLIEVRLPLAP